jgi:hypothetical protein
LFPSKIKKKEYWKEIPRIIIVSKVRVIRVSEPLKKENTDKYRKLMGEEWIIVRRRAVGGIEEDWERFKGASLRTSEEVCGQRTVSAVSQKSEWWSEEEDRGICQVVTEKRSIQ